MSGDEVALRPAAVLEVRSLTVSYATRTGRLRALGDVCRT